MKMKPGLKEETALTYCVAESNREEQRLTPWLTCLFSLTAALAVANVYFAQPLLESMATSLSVQSATVGLVVTLTQIGYAVGLLFIVPLGDLVNRKYLVITQLLLLATALTVAGLSQRWFMFLGAMALVGMMAVVVQIVVACTAALAAPAGRGKAVGMVTSGVVLGILLARLTSGVIADLAGWRAVYLSAASLMLLLAAVLAQAMPAARKTPMAGSYLALMTSVFHLLMTEPTLRVRGVFALLIFAAFSVLWTALVLPLSAQGLSHTQIGLFGVVSEFGK